MQPNLAEAQANKEVLKDFYLESLGAFCKGVLGYKDVNKHTHGDTLAALESDAKRRIIVLPRGCLKSSLCSVAYPLWRLTKNPNLRILIVSEKYTNAKNLLRDIKNHAVSPQFINTFAAVHESPVWNEGEVIFSTRTKIIKEPSIRAAGIGVEVTGQHFDIIILDDVNGPANSKTPEHCEKVVTYYKYLTSILEPDGEIDLVGTRYASNDAIGHILRNEVDENDLPEFVRKNKKLYF